MTPQTRPGSGARPSRRAVLGIAVAAGAAGVALAGCSVKNPLTDAKTPAADAVRDLAPDVAVAVQAATLLRGAQGAVTGTGDRHPELVATLAGLRSTHQAHLDAVMDAVPDGVDTSSATGAPYAVPARPATAVAQLVTTERSLHDGLVGLALRAESGAFARLLGAMAAAVSQQLRVLADARPADAGAVGR